MSFKSFMSLGNFDYLDNSVRCFFGVQWWCSPNKMQNYKFNYIL